MGSYTWVFSFCAVVLLGSSANAETVKPPVHPTPIAASRVQTTVKPRSTPAPKPVAKPAPAKPGAAAPAPVAASAPVAAPAVAAPAVAAAPALAAPVDVDAPASAVIGDTIAMVEEKPMTEAEIVLMYQRVGRDIQLLQNAWGTDKVLDLWPTFKAIKLKEQCKTAETRLELQATLEQLRAHVDRRKGITISADCLNNPLSANCR